VVLKSGDWAWGYKLLALKNKLVMKLTRSQITNSLKTPQSIQNYWVFGLRPSYGILNNTTFRKLDLFLFLGERRHILCWVPKRKLTSINELRLILSKVPDRVGVCPLT
jgi:hypothetical protein